MAKRRLPGEQFPENAPERVQVRPPVEVVPRHGLFGAHVGGGPVYHATLGEPQSGRRSGRRRDPEIVELRARGAAKDVLGLEVAMNDSGGMGIRKRLAQVERDAHDGWHAEERLPLEHGAERFVRHVRHDL